MDAKSKEVNFSRTEEIYQLAHRQAIIPPPLNIFVFGLTILWYIIDYLIHAITCNKYMVNVQKIKPVSIDYELELVLRQQNRQKLIRKRKRSHVKSPRSPGRERGRSAVPTFTDDFVMENIEQEMKNKEETIFCGLLASVHKKDKSKQKHDVHQYCQFCRHYMWNNGDISRYLALFRGYRLDDDDVKVIKNTLENRGLCPKCFRPFKLYSDGSSNRLARWQVVIEIISFYVFICFLYWSLLIALCLPALFVGLWLFIQNLADSSKHVSKHEDRDKMNHHHIGHIGASENNYRTLIRQIIAEETTTVIFLFEIYQRFCFLHMLLLLMFFRNLKDWRTKWIN